MQLPGEVASIFVLNVLLSWNSFLGASIITNISRPKYDISYALRNKIRLSGFELDLSTGEYNNKQLSTLSSSTFGTTTTLNTQQDRIFYLC